MNDQISQLAETYGLKQIAERIEQFLLPGIHISKTEQDDSTLGSSRLGGLPDVPPEFIWPHSGEKPLGFLAQFRCEDFANLDSSQLLPNTGILYFFYDVINQPWGFDPKDRQSAVVFYTDATTSLSRASMPEGSSPNEIVLPSCAVKFTAVPSLPTTDSEIFIQLLRQLGFSTKTLLAYVDKYREFYDEVRQRFTNNEPQHQLLGHPNIVQNDMKLECQLVTHGIYCGDSSGYEDPRRKELEAGAAEWKLLFQFDSDDGLGVMWGDCGLIYFWIRESDLRARRFSETWTIQQCS